MRIDSPQIVGNLSVAEGSEAVLTGSFTGSFTGDGSGLTGVAPIAGTGIDVTGTTVSVDATIATAADLTAHSTSTSNPHSVTATQVGLGNVDNTSDSAKPVSTATQAALDLKAAASDLTALDTRVVSVEGDVSAILLSSDADKDSFAEIVTLINSVDTTNDSAFASHATNTSNPHSVTKAQVGLGDVDNTADSAKPVSTAQQTALDAKLNASAVSTFGGTLIDDADAASARTTLGLGTGDTVQFTEVRATGDVVAYYSSDSRLKDNVAPIEDALGKVEAMGGYSFDWNDKQDAYKGHDLGVIAQEVQAVCPELVHERENGFLAVDYVKLTAVLIEAVKELSAKVEALGSK